MATPLAGAVLALYAAAVFAVGLWAQKRAAWMARRGALVTALSIGVYCTTWTFYGAVGTAARSGWDYLPIYLGPILAFTVGYPLIKRVVALGKSHGALSLSDLLSRRFGRSSRLAALVTMTLVAVTIPYIALQLIAVASTYAYVTGSAERPSPPLIIAMTIILAAVGLLLGVRSRDSTRSNPGLVAATAFGSLFKVVVFCVVAIVAIGALSNGPFEIRTQETALAQPTSWDRFLLLTVLSGFMMLCLPRQFHMTVVEAPDEKTVWRSAPLIVLYLLIFALLVLPILSAGQRLGLTAVPDLLVLTIPEAVGAEPVVLLALVGGFAAAAGMTIVTGVALSTMITSDIVLPAISRQEGDAKALSRALTIRRLTLLVLMAASAFFALVVRDGGVLADLGIVAFAGAGQVAPLILAALFLPRAGERAAFFGLGTGVLSWAVFVLGPTFFAESFVDGSALARTLLPFVSDSYTAGTLLSLSLGAIVLGLVSAFSPANLARREYAARFAAMGTQLAAPGMVKLNDLYALLVQVIGEVEAEKLYAEYNAQRTDRHATSELVAAAEAKLSRVLGNASTHILLTRLLKSGTMAAGDVMVLMGDASRGLRFGRDLLSTTLENLAEGVSLIDEDGRLVAWNRRYADLFQYPEELLQVGTPLGLLIQHNLPHLSDSSIERRVKILQGGHPHTSETSLRDGTILRLQGRPVPGGGYVTSFSDVTEYRETQTALVESEQTTRFYTDNVPFPIAFSDRTETLCFHNRAYADMVNRPGQDLTGRKLKDVLGQGYGLRIPALSRALQGEASRFVLLPEETGEDVTWQVSYAPQIGADGSVQGFFGFYQDISQRRAAQAALEEVNRTLEQRVVQRTSQLSAANEQLEMARETAESANLSKTRFLAAASHDVLQPLNAARLFASSLEDALPSDGEDAATARKISAAIVSADTLLRSLLNLSKLDAGAVDPKISTLDLGPYLSAIAEEFRPLAAEKGLELRCAPTTASVRTDAGLLRSALQNLISNAIRYTDKGGVLIGARRRNGQISVEVIDTGRGLAPDQVSHVFEEFARLKRDRDVDGAGLGLATVQRVARILSHPLDVQSEPGKGSVFRMTMARTQTKKLSRPSSRAGQRSFEGLKVLCVDNDRQVLEALKQRFEKWGATTDAHGELEAVRDAYPENGPSPDLLILDYQLDGGDTGLDVVDYLEATHKRQFPAIVVTASRSAETDAAIAAKGLTMLEKPVEPAALRAATISLLSARLD